MNEAERWPSKWKRICGGRGEANGYSGYSGYIGSVTEETNLRRPRGGGGVVKRGGGRGRRGGAEASGLAG